MSKKKKDTPQTILLQCEQCELILRVEEKELDEAVELPTFCHLIPDDDVTQRRVTCNSAKFRDVTDEAA